MNNKAFETEDARWAAVQARDASADAHFVYAVRTTGVYCRPSSTARLPKRENVEFFASAEAAEAAGYRSSRRARGDQTSAAAQRAELVARACRMIEASETPPPLDDLAAEVGMSPFHFHRLFKAETGLTPKAYSSAYRARKLRQDAVQVHALERIVRCVAPQAQVVGRNHRQSRHAPDLRQLRSDRQRRRDEALRRARLRERLKVDHRRDRSEPFRPRDIS